MNDIIADLREACSEDGGKFKAHISKDFLVLECNIKDGDLVKTARHALDILGKHIHIKNRKWLSYYIKNERDQSNTQVKISLKGPTARLELSVYEQRNMDIPPPLIEDMEKWNHRMEEIAAENRVYFDMYPFKCEGGLLVGWVPSSMPFSYASLISCSAPINPEELPSMAEDLNSFLEVIKRESDHLIDKSRLEIERAYNELTIKRPYRKLGRKSLLVM